MSQESPFRSNSPKELAAVCRLFTAEKLAEFLKNRCEDKDWLLLTSLVASGRAFELEAEKANWDFLKVKDNFHPLVWTTHCVADIFSGSAFNQDIKIKSSMDVKGPDCLTVQSSIDDTAKQVCLLMVNHQYDAFKHLFEEDPNLKASLDFAALKLTKAFNEPKFLDAVQFRFENQPDHVKTDVATQLCQAGVFKYFEDMPDGAMHKLVDLEAALRYNEIRYMPTPENLSEIARLAFEPGAHAYTEGDDLSAFKFYTHHENLSFKTLPPGFAEFASRNPRYFDVHAGDLEKSNLPILELIFKWSESGVLHLCSETVQQYVAKQISFTPVEDDRRGFPLQKITDSFLQATLSNYFNEKSNVLDLQASLISIIDQHETPEKFIYAATLQGPSSDLVPLIDTAVYWGMDKLVVKLADLGMDLKTFENLVSADTKDSQEELYDNYLELVRAKDAAQVARNTVQELRSTLKQPGA